ncbi:MAG: sugar porter family MFS transporter [Verrucomicrobiota bacterium]
MFYLCRICLVATLGGLLFGYDTAVISGTVDFVQAHFALSELELGWVVSSAILGCMLGAAVSGVLCDRLGRKWAFIVAAACFLISAVGTAIPTTTTELVLHRLLGGIGVGIASITSPMYIAEIAPERLRGRLVSLNQIAILTGMVLVYIVNAGIAGHGTHEWNVAYGWRWMFGSGALPALVFLLLVFTIPESPRWLVKASQEATALKILQSIHDPATAQRILTEIRDALKRETGGWKEVFGPVYRPALLVGLVLAIIQHGTGINAVMYYAPRIFSHAGIASAAAINHMVIISVVMVLFTFIGLAFVDKIGRKPLLLVSTTGMALSLFMLYAAYSGRASGNFNERAVLGWILAYVATFSIAMGPVVWVMISELFPNRVRGRCASIAVFFMWSASLAISQFFPYLLKRIDHGVFMIFGFLCVAAIVYMVVFVPETKGKTLEEIEDLWRHRAKKRGEAEAAARY